MSAASSWARRPTRRCSRVTASPPPASPSPRRRTPTRSRWRAKMEELSKSFPPGLAYSIPYDTTAYVKASIHEVYKTLYEAAALVLVVILVFLQDWRAMLVPATNVPVTIIGAFAAMAALGFTV